jgi:hypothetical protein
MKEYLGVTEPQRLALHAAARAALGEEEGDTLMALSPPANTDIATRQDIEHARLLSDARLGQVESRMQAYVWKVVVGTGIALYLALAATMLTGFQFLS